MEEKNSFAGNLNGGIVFETTRSQKQPVASGGFVLHMMSFAVVSPAPDTRPAMAK